MIYYTMIIYIYIYTPYYIGKRDGGRCFILPHANLIGPYVLGPCSYGKKAGSLAETTTIQATNRVEDARDVLYCVVPTLGKLNLSCDVIVVNRFFPIGRLCLNDCVSNNNHLIGKQPTSITSHDSCQSPIHAPN